MKIILIIIPILFLLSFAVTITIKYCNLLNTQEEIHKKNIDIDKENKKIALQSIEIKNENQRQLVCNIVRNKKCGTVLEDYIEYNKNKLIKSNSKPIISNISLIKSNNIFY